jgi:hypothetical protein
METGIQQPLHLSPPKKMELECRISPLHGIFLDFFNKTVDIHYRSLNLRKVKTIKVKALQEHLKQKLRNKTIVPKHPFKTCPRSVKKNLSKKHALLLIFQITHKIITMPTTNNILYKQDKLATNQTHCVRLKRTIRLTKRKDSPCQCFSPSMEYYLLHCKFR